jgi:outer membrane beta-barrel protein
MERRHSITGIPGIPGAALLVAALLVATLAGAPALAQEEPAEDRQPVEDARDFQRVEERTPRLGTPLIANKLYPMQYRLEITGLFDYSFNDKYVQHIGGSGALAFHLFDWLALEGFGGYLYGDETGIVRNVRNDGSSFKRNRDGQTCANPTCEPQLPDMWSTTWFAGADVQWAPIYGKISAVSEYDLNFQLYALIGGGAEGISRQLTGDANGDGVTPDFQDGGVRFTANYGLGVRLMPWKFVALRAEIRNYNGLNPNVEEHESRDEDACTTGYTLVVGTERQCFPDISNNTMLQVGISLIL